MQHAAISPEQKAAKRIAPPSLEQRITALEYENMSLLEYRQRQAAQIERLQYQVKHMEILMLADIPKFEDTVAMLAEMYARHIRLYQKEKKQQQGETQHGQESRPGLPDIALLPKSS